MSQTFSHRTQQSKDIHTITTSKKLLEEVLISHEFKEDHTQFYEDILNAKNVSIVTDSNDDEMIIKYEKYGLYALAKQDRNTNNNKCLILMEFSSKYCNLQPKKKKKDKQKKKDKKEKKAKKFNGNERSYTPENNVESGVNRVQGYIEVERDITVKIIPKRIMETHITDIYQYMDKMISLQRHTVINERIWILCFNYHCKDTGEPLYCIAVKIKDPEANRNFIWRLRPVLYTAKDILNTWKITEKNLPITVISSDEHLLKMQQVILIKRILSDPNERNKIFSTKKSWQKVIIFINEKQKNKEERKLGMRKKEFSQECINVANMSNDIILLPMLLFNEFNYSIDALWRVRIHDGLDIGISFTLNPKKTTVIPTGIHVSLTEMMVHCQLINTKQQIGDFFNAWVSKYNNFFVGDANAEKARYNRKIKEIGKDCELLRDENLQYKAVIKRYESMFERLKMLENSKVNEILHCDEKNISTDKTDRKSSKIEGKKASDSTLNPKAAPFCNSYDYDTKMGRKLVAVPEFKQMK